MYILIYIYTHTHKYILVHTNVYEQLLKETLENQKHRGICLNVSDRMIVNRFYTVFIFSFSFYTAFITFLYIFCMSVSVFAVKGGNVVDHQWMLHCYLVSRGKKGIEDFHKLNLAMVSICAAEHREMAENRKNTDLSVQVWLKRACDRNE